VLNATGSLTNWEAILNANNMTDWVPVLTIGQQIIIPDGLALDQNTIRQLKTYPACNNVSNAVYNQINSIFDTLTGVWILTTGFWDDGATWKDTEPWND
jgi:hypothetical protein